MRLLLIGASALALAACGESRSASGSEAAADVAETKAQAAVGGTAREVRGVSASTQTGSTELGEAATTTTAPNHAGGAAAPPPTLPEERPTTAQPPS